MNILIRPRRRRWVVLEAIPLLCVAAALIGAGIAARKIVWQQTEVLRYKPDMDNAWHWGSRSAKHGYFGLYDAVVKESPADDLGLDYAPLRLATLTLWARSRLHATSGPPTGWRDDYAFNAPLLQFNTAMELLACAAIFALARDWSRRDDLHHGRSRRWLRAEWLALVAAALLWFNPAVLLSAHARITWDVWILPFYLWAVFLGGRRWWFSAGCVMALGAMFKAQLLIMAPVFIIWLLMRWQIVQMLRFVLGFVLLAGVIVSPWIVGPRVGPIFFVGAVGLLPVVVWLALRRWPLAGREMPVRWLRWLISLALATALWLCVPLWHGSMNWYAVSVTYGAAKFKQLEVGGASSLTSILQHDYRWTADAPVGSLTWFGNAVTISQLLIACFILLLLPCGWAMARYARAEDRRFVLAAATPWLIYFAIFPKMHERYLLWGAGVACASTIVGLGPMALAMLFTILQTIMSLYQMLPPNRASDFLADISPHAGQMVSEFIRPTYPGIGWAMLLATAVWMWLTVAGAVEITLGPTAERLIHRPT